MQISFLALLTTLALGFVHGSEATIKEQEVSGELNALPQHAATARDIVQALSSRHYIQNELDNALSSQVFDAYLEALDPARAFLTTADVARFEIYRYLMDDSLRRGDLGPAYKMFNHCQERIVSRLRKNMETLEQDFDQFDFDLAESLEMNREDTPWARQVAELDTLWRKRLKNAVLGLRLAGKEPEEIREILVKRYRNRLSRFQQTSSEDVFQVYMNAFASTFDPHTQYFSPRASENFNINMSLSFEGIGAVLQIEDEYVRVDRLVAAGPADKSGQLQPNDRITGVAQGLDGEMVDVVGWRLDDVVDLIRGKKNSIVRLQIVSFQGSEEEEAKVIQLTRSKVRLEDQSASSEVLEIEHSDHSYRIGVIDIPAFYIDFQALRQGDTDYKSTTRDVGRLISELQKAGVDGIVIDLRGNSGGSLQEANSLVGLFIDRGPTVQVRNSNHLVDVLSDRDEKVAYEGPLAVLIDRLSASASEIFAGAIQDYQRGLVLGTQTFGKGTVQSLMPLNQGQLKLTQAKFYRISGESTQHQGVTPDIIFPARYDADSVGESALDNPLPWDSIKPAAFQPKSRLGELIPTLRELHQKRTSDSQEFHFLRESIRYRKEQAADTEISLNEAARRADKQLASEFWVSLENLRRKDRGLAAISSLDELIQEEATFAATVPATGITIDDNQAPEEGTRREEGGEIAVVARPEPGETNQQGRETLVTSDVEADALLQESSNILVDWISLDQIPAGRQTAAGNAI